MNEPRRKPLKPIRPTPTLDHVTRALKFACEVCKANPGKPCVDSSGIIKPVFDGCHTRRVYRGLYGRKMPPVIREADHENAEARSPEIRRAPEPKETLDEILARAMASFETRTMRRASRRNQPTGDDDQRRKY